MLFSTFISALNEQSSVVCAPLPLHARCIDEIMEIASQRLTVEKIRQNSSFQHKNHNGIYDIYIYTVAIR